MYNKKFVERSELRNADENCEKAFGNFLYNYLYPKLPHQAFERSNSDDQINGVDIWFINHNRRFAFDEKIAGHYLNCEKSNFVLELITPNGNRGWFINDNLKTDIYVFGWGRLNNTKFPVIHNDKQNDYYKTMDYEDITGVYVMFLYKSKIRRYLEENGYSAERLFSEAITLRNNTPLYQNKRFVPLNPEGEPIVGVRDIFCSGKLIEKPVNIIMRHSLLKNLSLHSCLVTKEKLVSVNISLKNMNRVDRYLKINEYDLFK